MRGKEEKGNCLNDPRIYLFLSLFLILTLVFNGKSVLKTMKKGLIMIAINRTNQRKGVVGYDPQSFSRKKKVPRGSSRDFNLANSSKEYCTQERKVSLILFLSFK